MTRDISAQSENRGGGGSMQDTGHGETFSRVLIDKALEFSGWDLLNPPHARSSPLPVVPRYTKFFKELARRKSVCACPTHSCEHSTPHFGRYSIKWRGLFPKSIRNAERALEIRRLEAEQAASRRRLDDLFQSMLHQAFAGEL
jgi:hypothetical protein